MMKSLPQQSYIFLLIFICTSCAQVFQNSGNLRTPRRPAQYGIDKFTAEQKHNAHYVEIGEGPPAILIPGLFGTYRGFSRMMPLLSPHFRLIALDNFGTGDSDLPSDDFNYTVAEQADRIVRLMDELMIPQATFIGVSYGGMISLNIAARYPERVRAVVCIEGGVIMPKPSPYYLMEQGLKIPIIGDIIIGFIRTGLFNEMIARDVMGHAWSRMETQDKAEVKDIISHYIDAATQPTWLGLARALRISDDFIDEARAIKAPVLYLYGNKTAFSKMIETNIEYFKKNLPNILLYSFEDGIHDLELQKPKETASLIVDFLVSEGAKNLAMQTTKLEIQESWKGLPGMSRHEYHESVFQ